MNHRAGHDLARRLGRLEHPNEATGEDSEWLTDAEFEEYAELRRSGVPIEAAECQRLLAVARARRARREPRPNELWRVDVEEGRPTVIPRLSDEEVEEWGEQVNAAIDERLAGGRLVERGDGNFSWVRDR